MAIFLIAFLVFFGLVAMCPGPPDPAVKLKGCRCQYCQWYVTPRDHCCDPFLRRLHSFPRWSFASVEEMVNFAKANGCTEDLLQRSSAYIQAEIEREMIHNIHHIRPITSHGPIHYYKPAAIGVLDGRREILG